MGDAGLNAGFSVVPDKHRINFGIPSRKAVTSLAEGNHGDDSWIRRAHKFFDQKWVQLTLIGLLCLDILIIFIELFLMSEYPSCRLLERDCVACCPESEGDHDERWLADSMSSEGHGTDDHHAHDICDAAKSGYDSTGIAACDSHRWQFVHITEEFLFYCTISILVIFLIENLVEMAALGVRKFASQIFLVLDFLVVLISLVLEILFHIMKSNFQEVVAMLVFFRLWRFIRIGHGLLEVSSEMTSKEYEPLFVYIKECEKKLKEQNISIPEKDDDVTKLIEGHSHDHH